MRIIRDFARLPAVLLLLCLLGADADAQQKGPGVKGLQVQTDVALKKVQAKLKEIEGSKELDQALKSKVLSFYQQALGNLESAAAFESSTESYVRSVKTAPEDLNDLQKKIAEAARPQGGPRAENLSGASLQELEFRLMVAGTESDALRGDLEATENVLREQKMRPAQIREDLRTARESLSDIEKESATLAVSHEQGLILEARRAALAAARKARLQEIEMLNRELFSYGPRIQLLTAQRDLRAVQAARIQDQVNALQEIVAARQKADADQRGAESAGVQGASGVHPAIGRLAEKNARLGRQLSAVLDENNQGLKALTTAKDNLRTLDREYREMKQKIEVAGRGRALGHILVEEYRRLPDAARFEQESGRVLKKIAAASLSLLETEEALRSPGELAREIEETIARDVDKAVTVHDRGAIERDLRQRLSDQQALLMKLVDAYRSYLNTLSDLENRQRAMVETVNRYRALIDEWILWIPSTTPFSGASFRELRELVAIFSSPVSWGQVGAAVKADIARDPAKAGLFVAFFLGLLWWRQKLKSRFGQIEAKVLDRGTDRFSLTLYALAMTIILALPLPLLFSFLGWRLQEAPEATEFTRALGQGFSGIVLPALYLRTFYHGCGPGGVAAVHFRWHEQATALLRHSLLWYTAVFLVLVFFLRANWAIEEAFLTRGGMLPFVAVTGATALFLQRVLRPAGGAVECYLKAHPAAWLSRLRHVWYFGAVLAPLVLIGLALFGYLYTAAVLSGHLIRSLWLVLGAVVVHELVLRWLSLAEVRLGTAAAEGGVAPGTKRESGAECAPAGGGSVQGRGALSDSSLQTLRMFHFLIGLGLAAGLLVVWSDVLPALTILQQVVLWQHTVTVAGKEVQQPFTLWSLAVMLTLIAATVAVWRNLPGVIDVSLLQRFRLSAASRYATKQMTKYSIVTIGIVAIFKSVGGEWSQIQWLVAALSVGLGFGLQEIVANFISGIIILFEQPIRVGDVVTIGDISGKVARIHIRATTITDFDNKDLIVPNKSFITGQLINWSLTSPVTRLTVKVGIAYGSDTARAHEIMLDTVRANPLVLKNPEPKVWFTGFGESSLDFTIYSFVQEMSDRLPLTHDLHMAIERALRDNGIEIPFPQRDVHIRSRPGSHGAEDDKEHNT